MWLLKKQNSPSKILAVLRVPGAKESTVKGDKDTSEERVVISSQECLISSRDDGSEELEKFCVINWTHSVVRDWIKL